MNVLMQNTSQNTSKYYYNFIVTTAHLSICTYMLIYTKMHIQKGIPSIYPKLYPPLFHTAHPAALFFTLPATA